MATLVRNRRGTAANWTALNPTLAAGQIGVEIDTFKFKVGNGIAAWNVLPYATKGDKGDPGATGPAGAAGSNGAQGPQGPQGPAGANGTGTVITQLSAIAPIPAGTPTGLIMRDPA